MQSTMAEQYTDIVTYTYNDNTLKVELFHWPVVLQPCHVTWISTTSAECTGQHNLCTLYKVIFWDHTNLQRWSSSEAEHRAWVTLTHVVHGVESHLIGTAGSEVSDRDRSHGGRHLYFLCGVPGHPLQSVLHNKVCDSPCQFWYKDSYVCVCEVLEPRSNTRIRGVVWREGGVDNIDIR